MSSMCLARRGLLRRCRRRRARLWLGWRVAVAALHSAQAALSVARAQQRRARERRRGGALRWWDEGGTGGPALA